MKYLTIMLIFISISLRPSAQGCSDAGFCSLGALKNIAPVQQGKTTIDMGTTVGIGEEHTFTLNPYFQYNYRLSKQVQLSGKITSVYANGFLGTNVNAGDIYLAATYAVTPSPVSQVLLLAGFKIPLTSSNDKNAAGKSLPLDYQSSIGTYDFIAGINYLAHGHLELDAAVQAPLIQINRNSFFPDEYPGSRAAAFAPTSLFRRKPDLLLRAGYYLPLHTSVMIKPNLLGIYHLGEDSYVNRLGVRTRIADAEGLTLNAGIVATKKLSNTQHLEFIAATPLVVRKVRPDGLTRAVAVSIQYSLSF